MFGERPLRLPAGDLAHGAEVDALHEVREDERLLELVEADLLVLDDGLHNELLDAKGDVLDVELHAPQQAVDDDDVAAIAALATAADLTTAAPRRSPRGSAVVALCDGSTAIVPDSEAAAAVAARGVAPGGGESMTTPWCVDSCVAASDGAIAASGRLIRASVACRAVRAATVIDGRSTPAFTDWEVEVSLPLVASPVSAEAHAAQKPAATADPIPRATANVPTLPT